MTEEEWLSSSDPWQMIDHLGERATARKLSLFACAGGRHIWKWLDDARSRAAVEAAEEFADGRIGRRELEAARDSARSVWEESLSRSDALTRGTVQVIEAAWYVVEAALTPSRWEDTVCAATEGAAALKRRSRDSQFTTLCDVLRHIIGNPFRPYAAPAHWPAAVVQLAEVIYAGQDGHHLALCDALLEAGHAELADHFRAPGHPKGCWALDVILGKS